MLQMQFLENKVALELTRSDYVEAEEVGHRFFFPIFFVASLHHSTVIKSLLIYLS